ncbi:MAG: hypothetical protein Q8N96_08135 [Methylovulum sp.]|nr:hypothetical protein [Methylovulum sp.]
MLDIIDKNSHKTKTAIAQLQEVTEKTVSLDTIKRILKSYH